MRLTLHETHCEQDLLEKESSQNARTIVLVAVTAWRAMCTRVASSALHDMPCIGISDNANAVVAVTKHLHRVPGRCAVHILNIPTTALTHRVRKKEAHPWITPADHSFEEFFNALEVLLESCK